MDVKVKTPALVQDLTSVLKKDSNNGDNNDDNNNADDTTDLVTKTKWAEISITPPLELLIGNNDEDEAILCPFPSCDGQIGKNKSLDTHLMKNHMHMKKGGESQGNGGSKVIKYFCPDIDCTHSINAGNKRTKKNGSKKKGNWFTRFKYVKQHYHKIHLPKDFTCKVCEKCFSTQVYLNIHVTMCGKTFNCSSCDQSYKSLEALQTHAKRKDHQYDYEKYRDIINSERLKSKLAAEKKQQAEAEIDQNQNAEKLSSSAAEDRNQTQNQLKETFTSIPINSIIILPSQFKTRSSKRLKSTLNVQNKPTYDKYFIRNLLKNDLGTQTITEEEEFHTVVVKIDQQSQTPQNIVNNYSHNQNSKKRKKCTATQTARVRVRISTDTQTSNIVKRARHSHKKKQPTTDTGIQAAMTFSNTTNTTTITRPSSTSSTSKLDLLLPITDYNTTSANSIFDIFPPPTSTTTATTIDNKDSDDPTKTLSNFLEDHRHTQTDPDLFFSDLNYYDYDYNNFLNFVTTETTETQTLCPSLSQSANNLDLDSSFTTTLNSKTIDITNQEDQLFSSTSTSNNIAIDDENPFYFETIDNETQTYDFSQILSFDNLN